MVEGQHVYREEYIDIEIFGHKFKELIPGNAEDLITLEKEGALYSKKINKEGEVKNYKVTLMPNEIVEYVEGHIAQQEFLEGMKKFKGDKEKDIDTISNKKIAENVRNYKSQIETKEGKIVDMDLRGCTASFMSEELEVLMCQITPRAEVLPRIDTKDKVAIITDMFESISDNINFLEKRKHNRPSFVVENEYDVQDLLYVMIKSIFSDAKLEEYTGKHAGGSKRIDIVLPSIDVVIETKFVRDKEHAKTVINELKIDIESYHIHPNCKTMCVLIYDPCKHIMDPKNIIEDISGLRIIKGKQFEVKLTIKN